MELRSRGQTLTNLEVERGNVEVPSGIAADFKRQRRKVKKSKPRKGKTAIGRILKNIAKTKLRRSLRIIQRNPNFSQVFTFVVAATAILLCLVEVVSLFLKPKSADFSSNNGFDLTTGLFVPKQIIFNPSIVFLTEQQGVKKSINGGRYADYGGLKFEFFEGGGTIQRQIYRDPNNLNHEYRSPEKERDDDFEDYYDFDDDLERGLHVAGGSIDHIQRRCRRTSEHRIDLQNCNNFHEQNLLELGIKFVGAGAYREVFSLKYQYGQKSEDLVMKDLLYEEDVEVDGFEFVRMDAMVAELVSSSPRTYDIYGFCGLSIMSEFFYHGDIEDTVIPGEHEGFAKQEDLHDEKELKPQNNLTATEKLILALEMAEGIAVLQGNSGGVIVHDDIQLSQFLLNKDKSILKINDFNRAEFMFWDEENQEYCTYKNGPGQGNWRAPEEYKDGLLNESIDVWSLGNNMYAILTGMNPMYTMNEKKMQKAIMRGEKAFIDPRYLQRSKEESKLAEIINRCFAYHPKDRPSIFEVVAFLRQAVIECLGENISRKDILNKIILED